MCDCIVEELRNNLDTTVVLHTESGCIRGLLVEVDEDCCKLICCNSLAQNGFARVTVCRVADIEAVTFCCCFR